MSEQKPNELASCLQKRLAQIADSGTTKFAYEMSYRKKWKELDKQLEQEEADDDERFQIKLEEYKDHQNQAHNRWLVKKQNLQDTIQKNIAMHAQLQTEIESLRQSKKLLRPNSAEEKANAVMTLLRLLRNTESEIENRPDSRICVACHSNPREEVLLPCSHCSLCRECSQKVSICPICRKEVSQRVRILWA